MESPGSLGLLFCVPGNPALPWNPAEIAALFSLQCCRAETW
jgi:hypothetical protein